MATYKLIQDVEAEDHILGPLTLRQFIFAMIACFFLYIDFLLITKGLSFMLVLFLPPTLFFIFFALPLGRDQPTEIWALAKLRYLFKPRQRIWNQDGVKELVTITAPKKVEPVLTNGLTQTEVKSRLRALANTLDTRGWAVKNVSSDAFASPLTSSSSDRLLNLSTLPLEVPDVDIPADADILDENSSPIAQQFETMIDESTEAHRQQLIAQMNREVAAQAAAGPAAPQPAVEQTGQRNDYWFMNGNPTAASTVPAPVAADIARSDDAALASELKERAAARPEPYSNLRKLQPAGSQTVTPVATPAALPADDPAAGPAAPMTAVPDPAILSLAKNDDLTVSTLAREAKRANGELDSNDSGEVVIALH